MRKKSLLTHFLAAACFSFASAESKFDGVSFSAGLGVSGSCAKYGYNTHANPSDLTYNYRTGQNNFAEVIDISYTHSLSDKYILGAGISYDFGRNSLGLEYVFSGNAAYSTQ